MAKTPQGLMTQIEAEALDSSVPLADALRKCIALGGRSGSADLRDWARRELEGYSPNDALPAYRIVAAIIAIDGATMTAVIKQQRIARSSLPDFAQDQIKEEVVLHQGVAELEHLISSSDSGAIKITLPAMGDLVTYMNSEVPYGNSISAMYWVVAVSTVVGVLDRTRTNLVALVAEMRAADPGTDVPSAEAARQAVSVVINGGKRNKVSFTSAQALGPSATANASAPTYDVVDSPRVPRWIHGPWGVLVGLGSIVSGLAGVAAWQGWPPF
ncbi:hypothetical protein KVF89_22850 [Nocardioides carbamazepini]|nr:hypothetical protein [Nocardioides carbamazepini]